MEGLKRGITGIKTMKIVYRRDIPKDRKVTYEWIVCNYRPQKKEASWCRITVGGDRVEYPGDFSIKIVDLTTTKFLLNSVLSKLRVRFMTADVNDLQLNTPLYRPGYTRIAMNLIPAELMK